MVKTEDIPNLENSQFSPKVYTHSVTGVNASCYPYCRGSSPDFRTLVIVYNYSNTLAINVAECRRYWRWPRTFWPS